MNREALGDIIQGLADAGLRGCPLHRRDGPTVARLAGLWAVALQDCTLEEVKGAARAWLLLEDVGSSWPAPADMRRVIAAGREAREAARPAADVLEEAQRQAGCEECAGTGTRTLVQHVQFKGRERLHIVVVVAPCDLCERGHELAAQRGSTWRDLWAQIRSPAVRPGVEWVRSYATGSRWRAHSDDCERGSPCYARLSPEEQYGPGERADSLRAAMNLALTDLPRAQAHMRTREVRRAR